jgi:hypothetical protein
MIQDPKRFAKIASGVQSWVLSGALAIGGGWTFYTFNSQLQVQNAEAQLEKLKHELHEEPRIELSLEVEQVGSINGKRLVVGNVIVKNVGTANTALLLDKDSLRIFKVRFDKAGDENWFEQQRVRRFMGYHIEIKNLISLVSCTNSIPFTALVEIPGFYVVTFSARRNSEERKALVDMTSQPTQTVISQTQAYFLVI